MFGKSLSNVKLRNFIRPFVSNDTFVIQCTFDQRAETVTCWHLWRSPIYWYLDTQPVVIQPKKKIPERGQDVWVIHVLKAFRRSILSSPDIYLGLGGMFVIILGSTCLWGCNEIAAGHCGVHRKRLYWRHSAIPGDRDIRSRTYCWVSPSTIVDTRNSCKIVDEMEELL